MHHSFGIEFPHMEESLFGHPVLPFSASRVDFGVVVVGVEGVEEGGGCACFCGFAVCCYDGDAGLVGGGVFCSVV